MSDPRNIGAAYTSWSETYDTDLNRTRDLDETVTREALSGMRFERILEIGCGTGKNTRLLVGIGDEVLALDFSEGMLQRARKRIRQHPGSDRVRFQVADVTRSWPCESGSRDLVTCNLVLEHIEDLDPVFSEAARCLAPGGLLWISELHPFRQYLGSQARFRASGGTEVKIEAFVHHVTDYLQPAARHGLTLEGLEEHWHLEDDGKAPRLVTFRFRAVGPRVGPSR